MKQIYYTVLYYTILCYTIHCTILYNAMFCYAKLHNNTAQVYVNIKWLQVCRRLSMSPNLLNLTLMRLYIFCTLRAREQKPWSR